MTPGTIEGCLSWLSAKAESGELSAGMVRPMESAINVLAPDRTERCSIVLRRVAALAERYCVAKGLPPSTMRSYQSRVTRALRMYLDWCDDPRSFRPATPKQARRRSRPAPPAENTYPLDDGRVVKFTVPRDLTVHEARKFWAHLLTFAYDFEPHEELLFP